jgi:hypothetical protein
MTLCGPEVFGADPMRIKWQVVRGDTAKIRVEFLENDETTYYDVSDWTFVSTTYDSRGDILDELQVSIGDGYVDIIASPDVTEFWGTGYLPVTAELLFDLQVTIDDGTVWTPVIGTIMVLGDVSGTL